MRWQPRSALLVDANILLLLVVGAAAPQMIESAGRRRGYTREDYEKARSFVQRFRTLVTTPHVLTEVTNLAPRDGARRIQHDVSGVLKLIYARADERHVHAHKLCRDRIGTTLGLADCGVIEAARQGCAVLSDDLDLCNEILSLGLTAINFNRIRFQREIEVESISDPDGEHSDQ